MSGNDTDLFVLDDRSPFDNWWYKTLIITLYSIVCVGCIVGRYSGHGLFRYSRLPGGNLYLYYLVRRTTITYFRGGIRTGTSLCSCEAQKVAKIQNCYAADAFIKHMRKLVFRHSCSCPADPTRELTP